MGRPYVLNENSLLLLRTAVDAGISTSNELANLMGQAHVETRAFSTMEESFRYTSVANLLDKVSSADDRFGMERVTAAVASRDPEQIAEVMYGARENLGNTEPGDGWRYHGRGFLQFTGRANYQEFGERFGLDLINNPDLAADPEVSARLAVAYWLHRVSPDQRRDIAAAGEAINGGSNGADARAVAARGWAGAITPALVADIQAGNTTLASLVHHHAVQRIDGPMSTGDYGPAVATLQQQLARLGHAAADGRALQPDGDYGRRTREAVASFQRANDLKADGVAGPGTLEVLERATSRLLDDARHPHHAVYANVLRGIHAHEAERNIPSGAHSHNLAAALTVEAIRADLHRVDRVEFNATGDLARAVQVSALRDEPWLNRMTQSVGVEAAVAQSIASTSEQVRQLAEVQGTRALQPQVPVPGL